MGQTYSSTSFFPNDGSSRDTRIMIFADGENFAIGFKNLIGTNKIPGHISYCEDVYVWSNIFNRMIIESFTLIRIYYYTSVVGATDKIEKIEDELKGLKIEVPRVFKKDKNKKSKMVDISLATDMLLHAFRNNYDIALLLAGDGDYVPLVQAVQMEGKRVYGWFIENRTNIKLKTALDYFADLTDFLTEKNIRYY